MSSEKLKKIGVEEHFHTPSYVRHLYSRKTWPRREIIEGKGERKVKEWWAPEKYRIMPLENEMALCDFEGRVKTMDKYGIDIQILSLSFPGVEYFSAEEAIEVSKTVNDEIADVISRFPERFFVLATIPVQNPQVAAYELERCVKNLGFKGAVINGNVRGEYLDDKKYWVIFECAQTLDVPIYIHPRIPPEDIIKYFDPYPGLHTAMLGFSVDAGLHALRLILSGVFDEFPNLKVILGHLGEALPFWLWRLDSRWHEEIQVNPLSASFYSGRKRTPSECFLRNFFVTTSGMFWGPVLKFVCSVVGAERILFATDYPYESLEEAIKFIEGIDLDLREKEKICYENAKGIFHLNC